MASHWECPLCLETLTDACDTSCGHSFCARCILQVWESDGRHRPIRCPIDRRNVSMLIPSYALRAGVEAYRRDHGQPAEQPTGQYDAQLDDYNQRFANAPRPVVQRVQEDWVLFNRVMSGEMNLHKLLTIVVITIGVLYLIVPFDIIPDSAGFTGLLDDLLIWLFVLWYLFVLVEGYRRNLAQGHHQ